MVDLIQRLSFYQHTFFGTISESEYQENVDFLNAKWKNM